VAVVVHDVPERFAVAFTYASEQRKLVLPVAQEVERILGPSTVFYDKWYEHYIAGQDADLVLQKIYGENTELVVVCVSGAYGDKQWTTAEYRSVRARLMQADTLEERHSVLQVRVGDGDIKSRLFNDAVPDIRGMTPTEAAELIIARLKLARGCARDAKQTAARWPDDPPSLLWPMAGHREARAAFAQLLREANPKRALLVQGNSETGKSHMSVQMLRNARRLPGIVSGCFDFKGTASMQVETEAFSMPLGIKPPTGQTLNERFTKIFTELQDRAQPALLIFDTFEAAEEATGWIERVLLPQLCSARWLRVAIIGQSVPNRFGSPWEEEANTLLLRPPSPEDWLAYGRDNRDPNLSLELVREVYKLARGRASIIASMLGPAS
jgi:hypothetical protein